MNSLLYPTSGPLAISRTDSLGQQQLAEEATEADERVSHSLDRLVGCKDAQEDAGLDANCRNGSPSTTK
jgi:hypothetical protein